MPVGMLAVVRSRQSVVRARAVITAVQRSHVVKQSTIFGSSDGVVDSVDNVHGLCADRKISSERTQDGVAAGYRPAKATFRP